jgi:hypothetical protein
MSKQYSKYFKAIIKELTVEPKKYLERVSFWKCIERTKDEYFMLCSFLSAGHDFKLKISIKKEEYEKSKVNDEVSIHLNFSYDFTCFHYKEEKKEDILIIERNSNV